MKRLAILLALPALFVLARSTAGFAAPPTKQPNFVVITIDDLGYADIGPFGSRLNRTPHLDRMAREGRKLTSFYAAPVCSPSRAALMTGCYPKRSLPIPHVLFPAGAVGLHPNERTVAEILKAAGYRTACIGKWHLGDQPEFLPTAQGFDTYLGIPYSNDMGTAEDGSKSDLGAPLPQPKPNATSAADDEAGLRGASQPPLPLLENDKVVARLKQDGQQAIVETYTAAAVKFIKENAAGPFFLYLPHTAVHFPLYPGKEWVGKSGHGLYSDWIEEVDNSVGQILTTLRELKLDQQTLVIFTSDNGGTSRAVNSPLRGNKGSTWEGGVRVPTLAWWPGRVPANSRTDEITGMFDILPTLAKLGGGEVPSDRKIDGLDISPVLFGERNAKAHEEFYFFRGLELQAVRSGPWKLHLATSSETIPANRNRNQDKKKKLAASKAVPAKTGPTLFNLQDDVGESHDVAEAHPHIVERLANLADAMDADLGKMKLGPGVRPLGRVANPRPFINQAGQVREDAARAAESEE